MLKIIKKNTNSLPRCTKYGYVCSHITFKYLKRLEKRIANESR